MFCVKRQEAGGIAEMATDYEFDDRGDAYHEMHRLIDEHGREHNWRTFVQPWTIGWVWQPDEPETYIVFWVCGLNDEVMV